MRKYIVITSINKPTKAVELFAGKSDYELVVVGDKKTPDHWSCVNSKYLSVEDQREVGTYLRKILPYNHYCRKMLGYLYAIANNADVIVDTDDDNIPYSDWCFPEYEGRFSVTGEQKGFVNIYQLYTSEDIWPRGLPLRQIKRKDFNSDQELETDNCKVGIWQGLADEDPDVDAVYRLTSDAPVFFGKRAPVVLGRGTISPFNTQNTVIRKELFALMYLPTYVTFRFTDILRGLIAQPIMWSHGYQLGFTNATVIQKRNPHDYFQDFLSELPMYEHCENVVEIAVSTVRTAESIDNNLFNVYDELQKNGVVEKRELETLEAWIKDLQVANF